MDVISQTINEYLHYLTQTRRRSQRTARNYHLYLSRFGAWMKMKNLNCARLHETALGAYKKHLRNLKILSQTKHFSERTVNYHLTALREFLKYLRLRGKSNLLPDKVVLASLPARATRLLTDVDLEKILAAPLGYGKNILAARDKALLELLAATGLKVSLLAQLKKDCLQEANKKLRLASGGVLPLSPSARHFLEKYLRQRVDNLPALFVSYDRAKTARSPLPLSARSIERVVARAAREAGISGRVTPEMIRRAFAARLLRQGLDAPQINEKIGHKQLLSTRNLLKNLK